VFIGEENTTNIPKHSHNKQTENPSFIENNVADRSAPTACPMAHSLGTMAAKENLVGARIAHHSKLPGFGTGRPR
jgi:hypothetical protein